MMVHDAVQVAQVLAGEKTAFGALVVRHRPGAMRLAWRLLGESVDAEDVVQEAFLQAFLSLHTLQTPARFGAWLLGIVVNLCRMHLRQRHYAHRETDWWGGRLSRSITWSDLQPSAEMVYEARERHQRVLEAIATLPGHHQEAVRQHYFDGLSLGEISLLSGVPIGTLKARLHRARGQLQRALEPDYAVTRRLLPCAQEDVMIEVTVHDVMWYVPTDEEALRQHMQNLNRNALALVVLKEQQGERLLPFWVGIPEGNALALGLGATPAPRPMTHDLMALLLATSHSQVEKVAVTRLHAQTFYATVWLRVDDRVHEIDARPSDVLNLALRTHAPIFVEAELFALTSVMQHADLKQQLLLKHTTDEAKRREAEVDGKDYRSFRVLPKVDMPQRK